MRLSLSERFKDKGLIIKCYINLFICLLYFFALFVTFMTLCSLRTMRFFHVLLTPH